VYLLSWVPYLIDNDWSAGALWRLHESMARYHAELTADHPYKSKAWSWPVLGRPVNYWFEADGSLRSHIVNVGNPVFWWTTLPALAAVAWVWVRSNTRTVWVLFGVGLAFAVGLLAGGAPRPVVLAVAGLAAAVTAILWIPRVPAVPAIVALGYGFLFVPWLFVARAQFLFYMAPVLPFMALAWAWAARELWKIGADSAATPWERLAARAGVLAGGVLVLIAFVLLYPIWTALPVPKVWWEQLMLLPSWI
jgi:dolichyl-phosphate-mannose-protein mannosyltransferase